MSLDTITSQIQIILATEMENLLKNISKDYGLNFDELKKKYMDSSLTTPLQSEPDAPKRRGRKKKPQELQISTDPYTFEGVTYLVDSKNTVYTYDTEKPMVVGEKLIDGTVKFSDQYSKKMASQK